MPVDRQSEQRRYPVNRDGVDFGLRADDYATFRPGFPASFFDRIKSHRSLDGIDAVDLGTGPGVVALDLARRGATVTGVDISSGQIQAGERRAIEAGLEAQCRFVAAPAEHTTLPDQCADLVTAGQCWGWFDEPQAMQEVQRLLRPGGLFVIGQYCYLPGHSAVATASEALIMQLNPEWTMSAFDGLYPQRIDAMITGGFEFIEQACWDYAEPFTHDGWRGRMRTCNGVGSGGMNDSMVEQFDVELTALLERDFAAEPLVVPHRVWMVIGRQQESCT